MLPVRERRKCGRQLPSTDLGDQATPNVSLRMHGNSRPEAAIAQSAADASKS
jgi:hypothetical protein